MTSNAVSEHLAPGTGAMQLRAADARGRAKTDWLDSRHTFSFGHYYDARYTGFRDLLVINEDRVVPGGGFATHGHRDMEIISYVLEGALEHKDSIGTGSVIRPGELQRMSAGTGIQHSEYNHSQSEPVHFLQIWITPDSDDLPPSYEQKVLAALGEGSRLDLIGSRDGRDGSVTIHQDVNLYRAWVRAGESLRLDLREGRHAWLQVARGAASVNDVKLAAGDGLAVSNQSGLTIEAAKDHAEILVFDLA
ncbi:MAG: pirin family protein [Gammaproteobacteria bacterium]